MQLLEIKFMKAIIYTKYGSPDVLQLKEVEKPTPRDDEILIKVRAASVNPHDFHSMRGLPYILRAETGLRKPKNTRLGLDLAGQVEAVGRDVTQFQPGDEVFGIRSGSFAEYVCTQGKALTLKPANLTFEEAAAVPVAALTALQGLRDKGRIQPGQKVLINGAAGGVGTFAVQIAKALGAEVTAVCSTRNMDMVRSLGADQVIDYTQKNFTQSGQRYDLLFDCVGNHSLSACRRAISPTGIYVTIAGSPGHLLKLAVLSRFVSQRLVFFISATNKEDLVVLKEFIEAKKVTPVIDRRYTLGEVPEAIRYLGEGHARGKVVVSLEHNNKA
jgi:NADPH:quinone reductase-like Zn-dependent oxidoreductase